jgi:hypothetical protein
MRQRRLPFEENLKIDVEECKDLGSDTNKKANLQIPKVRESR